MPSPRRSGRRARAATRRTRAGSSSRRQTSRCPASVSGWASMAFSTFAGAVATSQPSLAAVTACIGFRSDAASTCASRSGPQRLHDLGDHRLGVDRDVVEPPHEAGDVGGARLDGEQRLGGGEHERLVDRDAARTRARAWRRAPRPRTGPSRRLGRRAPRARGPRRSWRVRCPRRPPRTPARPPARRCGGWRRRDRPPPLRAGSGWSSRPTALPRPRSPPPRPPIRCR